MDTATQYDTLGKGIGAGFVAPNEARKKIDLKPVKGGDTPYLQQQNYSLSALDRRDQASPAPSDQRVGDRRKPSPDAMPEEEMPDDAEGMMDEERAVGARARTALRFHQRMAA